MTPFLDSREVHTAQHTALRRENRNPWTDSKTTAHKSRLLIGGYNEGGVPTPPQAVPRKKRKSEKPGAGERVSLLGSTGVQSSTEVAPVLEQNLQEELFGRHCTYYRGTCHRRRAAAGKFSAYAATENVGGPIALSNTTASLAASRSEKRTNQMLTVASYKRLVHNTQHPVSPTRVN